jgi:hypothetical protein
MQDIPQLNNSGAYTPPIMQATHRPFSKYDAMYVI